MAGRGKANSVDVGVGSRVRLRRVALGISQEALGSRLSLTFQQIQKFESGSNRISASYLFDIANVLRVPVSYFFAKIGQTDPMDDLPVHIRQFITSAEGLQLWRAFSRIKDAQMRKRILDLIKSIAGRG
jgi:transcriptional regulator with XRE-family HTH domain